jgi:mRNA-degrading endonuclease toxin of MazEF toxin-antitoxin module
VKAHRGFIYQLAVDPGDDPDFIPPAAERVLVLSEDRWNGTMKSSVIVPLYPRASEESQHAALLQPPVDDDSYADCTLLQSLDDDDLGDLIAACAREALYAVVRGVRTYLDVDALLARKIKRPPAGGRSTFWPRQRDVYWGRRFETQRERYLIAADDEFNIRSDRTAALFLTSRSKNWRSRWQVAVRGGFVISGDIDQFAYVELDEQNRPQPGQFTRDEMAEVAAALVDVLEL